MGRLYYGGTRQPILVEDRVLAHLQVVMISKLRRNEPFALNFDTTSLWITPSVPLHFDYDGAREPRLNRMWIEQLALHAASASGLTLTDEPPPEIDAA
jgi:hypothetical protein